MHMWKNRRFYQNYWSTFGGVEEITFDINQTKLLHQNRPAWVLYFRSNYDTEAHTICVCSRLLFYSKCAGFTICFTYNDISPSMYINQCKIKVELPYLRYVVGLLPQKQFFERFWRILSSPFTVPYNRKTREESLFWKGSSAGAIFSPKIASLRFQSLQQKRRLSYNEVCCGTACLWRCGKWHPLMFLKEN